MLRKILQFKLKIFAKLVLWKYKPVVVAVTGSVGKTSTKEAIFTVLKNHFGENQVRRNERSYNNEIGVPLTIFGLETGGKKITAWIARFIKIFLMLIFREKYPRILVIEMGADRPGDIKYLTKFVKAKVGVVTTIGDIPVHVEFFDSPQELALEKKKLIDSLKPVSEKNDSGGVAVLNYDDDMVKVMGEESGAKILTYGFGEGADVRATNYETTTTEIDKEGIFGFVNFKLNFKGSSVPVRLFNVIGKHQVSSALAAAAVGISFNLNLIDISEELRNYKSLPGRMKLLKGIKNTLIIDDSYNAAPLSTLSALDTLGKLEDAQKIVVLGDMSEIGRYTLEAHQRVGRKAAEVADYIVTVGLRAKFIAEGAREKKFPEDKLFSFETVKEAGLKVQELMKEKNIVLVKGSRVMKMEGVVKEIMAEPQKAKTLLV